MGKGSGMRNASRGVAAMAVAVMLMALNMNMNMKVMVHGQPWTTSSNENWKTLLQYAELDARDLALIVTTGPPSKEEKLEECREHMPEAWLSITTALLEVRRGGPLESIYTDVSDAQYEAKQCIQSPAFIAFSSITAVKKTAHRLQQNLTDAALQLTTLINYFPPPPKP